MAAIYDRRIKFRHPAVAAAASRALSEVEGLVEGSVQEVAVDRRATEKQIT